MTVGDKLKALFEEFDMEYPTNITLDHTSVRSKKGEYCIQQIEDIRTVALLVQKENPLHSAPKQIVELAMIHCLNHCSQE